MSSSSQGNLVAAAIGARKAAEALFLQASYRARDLETSLASAESVIRDLSQQLDIAEQRARVAEGRAISDGSLRRHARTKAHAVALVLIDRCRELAKVAETTINGWEHDLGWNLYPMAGDALCWLLDNHTNYKPDVVHQGRDLLTWAQTFSYLSHLPEAQALAMALRDLDMVYRIEEASDAAQAQISEALAG